MADAEDLKSSGDFSSCGFDSHPGHHCFRPILTAIHHSVFDVVRRKSFPFERREGIFLQFLQQFVVDVFSVGVVGHDDHSYFGVAEIDAITAPAVVVAFLEKRFAVEVK